MQWSMRTFGVGNTLGSSEQSTIGITALAIDILGTSGYQWEIYKYHTA